MRKRRPFICYTPFVASRHSISRTNVIVNRSSERGKRFSGPFKESIVALSLRRGKFLRLVAGVFSAGFSIPTSLASAAGTLECDTVPRFLLSQTSHEIVVDGYATSVG